MYVEEPVYDDLVHKLVAKSSKLNLGMDTKHDYSCDVGAVATEQQQLATVSSCQRRSKQGCGGTRCGRSIHDGHV